MASPNRYYNNNNRNYNYRNNQNRNNYNNNYDDDYNNYNGNGNGNGGNNYWKSRNNAKYQPKKQQGQQQWQQKNVNDNEDNKMNDNNNKNQNQNQNQNQINDPNQSKFSFSIVKGDLFTAPQTSALCHCISRDLGMGKGIALIFKKKFGGVAALRQQQVKIGECGLLLRQNRYIYYLITKERYFHKPSYDSLRQTLEWMRNHAIMNGVDEISMPKIGCGLDRLQWPKVETIIKNTFMRTDIKVTVYEL